MGTAPASALAHGTVEVTGRLPWSSNFTFLVAIEHGDETVQAIYKPLEGEQPLWDFPAGLFRREVAAYALAEALGWPNIPETVVRQDAPFGIGSLQRFVAADFEEHYFSLLADDSNHEALMAIAAFDVIANNADRKAGHCLVDGDQRLWAIDHGLCFHREEKLRTVIWDFAGEAVPETLLVDLARLAGDLPLVLPNLLAPEEVTAVAERITRLLDEPTFPEPTSERQYPWPLI